MIKTVATAELAVNEKLSIKKNSIKNGSGGKRLSIVTGTHGDELEGQYFAYLLSRTIQENMECLNGMVDIYPALNPLGIDSVTRGIPGFDLDMNRMFPGSKEGTMPEVLCASIIEDIEGSDFCIDVHASNIFLTEIPQIRINKISAEELVPYAKMLNVDFIWVHENATVLESTLAYALNARGTKTLVVEMGVGMRITKKYGEQLVEGVLNLMKQEGMWTGETSAVRKPLISENGEVGFVNSDAAGIFVPLVDFGSMVKKGDCIGQVVDPLEGRVNAVINAVCDGMVFTLRDYPVVYGGSLLARILMTDKLDGEVNG